MVSTVATGVLMILTTLVGDVVRSIAPGDEDTLCTREPHFAQSQPTNLRFLLDSYNYQRLLPGVWQSLDVDGEGKGVSAKIPTVHNCIACVYFIAVIIINFVVCSGLESMAESVETESKCAIFKVNLDKTIGYLRSTYPTHHCT